MRQVTLNQSLIPPDELKKLMWRTSWKRYTLLSIAYGILVWIVFSSTGLPLQGQVAISIAVIFILLLGLRFISIPRISSNPKNRYLHASHDITIDENRITFTSSDGSSSTIPWSSIVKVEEVRGFTLLWVSARNYLPIPHKSLSEADLDQLRDMVSRLVHFQAK
jgi:hypothetical protein